MNPLTQQGIAAYKAGNKVEARRLLRQALQQDANDIPAWLCLSGTVEEIADQAYCLQMVLRLDPGNPIARKGMAKIEQSRSQAAAPQAPAQEEAPAIPDFRAELLYTHTSPFTTQEPEPAASPFEPPARPARPEPAPSPAPTLREDLWSQPSPVSTPAPAAIPEPAPEPAHVARQPQRQPGVKGKTTKRPRAKQSAFKPWMWAALGGMGLLTIITMFVLLTLIMNRPKQALVAPVAVVANHTPTPAHTATHSFPPTYTPTTTATPRPTRTPTPTATNPAFNPTNIQRMSNVQKEVSDLRGLPIQADVPGFMVNKKQAEELLRSLYITDSTRAELENEKRALVILGFVKPSYDLVNLTLNHMMDNIGGFYLPDKKEMYIMGTTRFGGVQRMVYSHEFDHALVDQAFDISKLQDCPADGQRCQAVKALIEGDAQLLMMQWFKQYASQRDFSDLARYAPPRVALPEQVPPPFLYYDVEFAYIQGQVFVEYLFKRGNWAAVNRAYERPPVSTEQILHPEKYTAGEEPIPVFAPAIETALGSDWQIITDSTLGEWTTYLMLYAGADEAAQVPLKESKSAATGWGGDHYQVYYSPSADQSALAVQWSWDSEKDAREFNAALKKHLHELYRGSPVEQEGAQCWQINNQATCFITRPSMTLWLTAPDLEKVNIMWSQYADFKQN